MSHTCHAIGCKTEVPPKYLMCLKHWKMVPREIQGRVWSTYRPGQCDDMSPSKEWHEAADLAIKTVAEKEGKPLMRLVGTTQTPPSSQMDLFKSK